MDKKKVLIGLGVVALLIGGYFLYTKVIAPKDDSSEKKSDDSSSKTTTSTGIHATEAPDSKRA